MSHMNTMDAPSPNGSMSNIYMDGDYTSKPQSPISSAYNMSMSFAHDLSSISNVYPSPEAEEDASQPAQGQNSAPKRKRENRYKNAPPSVLSRRRAQNRASQRAYRERKDQRIKDLDQMLNDAKQRNDVLSQAFLSLQAEYMQLKAERASSAAFQQQQQQQSHSHPADLAFGHHPGLTVMTGAGPGAELLDMDLFVYPDLTNAGYSLT